MSTVGRTYLERGKPVVIVIQWGPGGGPRNVAIRRADGGITIRPFRGLRKPKPQTEPATTCTQLDLTTEPGGTPQCLTP